MRALILCCYIFLFTTLSAQQKVAERMIGWNEDGIELHTVFDKSKQPVCLVLMNFDSIKAFVLNGSIQNSMPYNLKRNNSEKFLGGFYKENCIFLFFYDAAQDRLHTPVLNLVTGEIEQYFMPFIVAKEKIIDIISCGDHFVFFVVDRKASTCKLYDFDSESHYTMTVHPLNAELWKELLSGKGIAHWADVEKAGFSTEGSIDVAASKMKIAMNNDILYLLVNNSKGSSEIYAFNLRAHSFSLFKINHLLNHRDSISPKAYKDNAFLLGNKLYYVFTTPDTLGLQVIDINTRRQIKNFGVSKDEDIRFKNTVIRETGGGTLLYGNKPVVLDKTKQLIRKMMNTEVVIFAGATTNQLVEIYIGSYENRPAARVGLGGMSTVPSAGGGRSGIYEPNTGFAVNSWSKSTGFKMVVDPKTEGHIEAQVKQPILERIEAYSDKLDISIKSKNIFMYQGIYFFVYYDLKARKLCILNFS